MKIGIQNFQGVGPYTEIELAPLTLLYGPNSAGKSTMLDALEFIQKYFGGAAKEARESLVRLARYPRERDYQLSEPPGTDYVAPASDYICSQEDVAFLISSRFSDESSIPTTRNSPFSVANDFSDGILRALHKTLHGLNYSVLVSFCDNRAVDDERPWGGNSFNLYTYYLEINGIPFFIDATRMNFSDLDFVGDPTGGFAFNFSHPVMEKIGEACLVRSSHKQYPPHQRMKSLIERVFDKPKGFAKRVLRNQISLLEQRLFPDDRGSKGSGQRKKKANDHWQMFNGELRSADLELDWANWAPLRSGIRDALLENDDAEFLAHFFDIVFKFHCPVAHRYGHGHQTHVPPLRHIPKPEEWISIHRGLHPREIQKEDSLNQPWNALARNFARWAVSNKSFDGISAAPSFGLLNEALAGDNYLALGYEIRGDLVFELESSSVARITSGEQALLETLEYANLKVHFFLWDLRRDTYVELQDVGVGVSQVIPVLAAALGIASSSHAAQPTDSVVFIQQPELHLHPALQAQLGDVFLRRLENPQDSPLVLETHSEHLLLRILRRIRETHLAEESDGEDVMSTTPETPLGRHQVRASQVAVIYASKNEQGLTTFKRLRLTDDGEFIDRWPGGFFAERERELFPEE
jgi:hypothetical protein